MERTRSSDRGDVSVLLQDAAGEPDGLIDSDIVDAAAAAAARRSRRVTLTVARIAVIAAIFASWELSSRYLIDPFWVSMPSKIFPLLWQWALNGYLWSNLFVTLQEAFLGLILGSLLGIGGGLLLGYLPFVASVLQPLISALYSMPRIALAPLFVLWFGIGILPKILLVAFIVFFLTFGNTYSGVRSVDRDLIDVIRIMGASRTAIILKVVIPSATAWIFAGLRLAAPYAIVGAVTGEFVASVNGMGYILRAAAGVFDTAAVFAGMIALMIVGFLLDQLLLLTERRLGRWRATEIG